MWRVTVAVAFLSVAVVVSCAVALPARDVALEALQVPRTQRQQQQRLDSSANSNSKRRISSIKGDWWWPQCNAEKCGELEPAARFQKSRRSEYSEEDPFFQWYYFYVQDRESSDSIAIAYAVSYSGDSNEGAYVSLSFVPGAQSRQTRFNETFYLIDKYPVNSWHSSESSDGFSLNITSTSGVVLFSLTMDRTANRALLQGDLSDPNFVWYSTGTVPKSLTWDLKLERVYGWYGQEWLEDFDEIFERGELQWNTWAHCSQVQGIVRGGSQTLMAPAISTRYRAYGDMNWGLHFPVGPPSSNSSLFYSWGWYYVGGIASDGSDLSFIAGTGNEYAGSALGTMSASFADFRLSASEHVEMIVAGFWENQSYPQNFAGTNDGELLEFEVERSQWIKYEDRLGTAQIPLRQVLTARTSGGSLFVLDFQSDRKSYNRLLFPTRNMIFSDFEGLGVTVHVTFSRDGGRSNQTFVSHSGGLEFGYHV